MSDIREVTNPHDKVTIDYTDVAAARMAVIIVGEGAYGIDGENGMPIFLFGGGVAWIKENYGMTPDEWFDSISNDRIIKALASFSNVGRRTSLSDIVSYAHRRAEYLQKKVEVQP